MNIRDMRVFQPFTVSDGRCILSSPEAWREPLEWQREQEHLTETAQLGGRVELVNVLVQPDQFAGYMVDVEKSGDIVFQDIRRDLFALIDRTPLLTFWIPTRHPERVMERWPQNLVDGHKYATLIPNRQNVRLGLFADIAKPADLMRLADLCGGVFVLRDDGEVEVLG